MERIYVIKYGATDYGETLWWYLREGDMQTIITTDYVAATKWLLRASTWTSTNDMVWLEVYRNNKEGLAELESTHFYNCYGITEIGKKVNLDADAKHQDIDYDIYYDIIEIHHYIPDGYEKLYKKAKMEMKLDK